MYRLKLADDAIVEDLDHLNSSTFQFRSKTHRKYAYLKRMKDEMNKKGW